MGTTIVTTDDLREFKMELLDEIKEALNQEGRFQQKKWIRSAEVMELLSISPGTLQNLRINGTIPYTKIGGVLYYDSQEIHGILEKNRIDNRF
ncbi:helix-turn-helix domain-containing protein [Galbibacter sp. BG1]|uniref:helix-turn-helix domain-containing protein n=1 Tax=Galbibacter sp. BG1 TaxID=1170699 RepID=UPI0015BBB084|nr:helix-turn-helix domain-containing protein [Galbibacter sp. BG1]QLE01999.1 helix-turn-helix domain-containing protein [Galbibacter sp. BG1]